jgi:PAS domain S-box-containing protein
MTAVHLDELPLPALLQADEGGTVSTNLAFRAWLELTAGDEHLIDSAFIDPLPSPVSKDPIVAQLRLARSDGARLTASVHARRLERSSSTLYIFHDETGRYAERDRARQDRRRLEALMETLPDGIMVENAEREIAFANAAFSGIFGLPPPAKMIGADCAAALDTSKQAFRNPEAFAARVLDLLARREPALGDELELVNGRTLQRDYVPIELEGVYTGHLWRYVDVTEKRRVARQLDVERRRNTAIIDRSLSAVITATADGAIVSWNPAAERIFGHSAESAIGRDISTIIPRKHVEAHRSAMRRARETGVHTIINRPQDLTGARADGTEFPCELVVSKLPAESEKMYVAFLRDTTLVTEARRLLEETSAAKGRLMRAVAHDMRSPLTSLYLALDLLALDSAPSDQSARMVMKQSVERIVALVDDLCTPQATESGVLQIESQLTNPRAVVEELIQSRAPAADQAGVRIEIVARTLLPNMQLDERQFARVLGNLVDNALKYAAPGHVTVELDGDESSLRFAVEDTGPGIAPADEERIFRFGTQLATSAPGDGLGLAIARDLAERMGGTLRLLAPRSGKGSRFELSLPRKPPRRNASP